MTPIERRAERCKHQFPKDKYILAHRALSGDPECDFEWVKTIAKRRTIRSKLRAAVRALIRG